MPGFVILVSLVYCLLAAALFVLIASILLKLFTKFSWKQSIFYPIVSSVLIFGILFVIAFGPRSNQIPNDKANKSFSEFARFEGQAVNGLYFQDGLSDGEYYLFQFKTKGLALFEESISKRRKRQDDYQVGASYFSGFEPEWYRATDCSDVRHYDPVRGRSDDAPYVERFTLHFCSKTGKLFADNVRI